MKVRIDIDIPDYATMLRIAGHMLDTGYVDPYAIRIDQRASLMNRLRCYLAENGLPIDDPDEFDPHSEILADMLWTRDVVTMKTPKGLI